VSFEKAKAYAEWLSKLTGQIWRLPNEKEVAPLYENSKGENTLDYWAGYALNPDDVARLESKIKELGGEAPLLQQVGTFPGVGKDEQELLFDLGGNVAEWAVSETGGGKLLGGSADRPGDLKSQRLEAGPAYCGFRVVRGEMKT
jgi:formylglycine-generating enzyme required for sulfatase activity